uniref:Sodium/hydrogen exchanger family protein n=1 Tax=Panagrellus redivivus TaxID=6233 RepID=A0A7E4VFU2_PANRE
MFDAIVASILEVIVLSLMLTVTVLPLLKNLVLPKIRRKIKFLYDQRSLDHETTGLVCEGNAPLGDQSVQSQACHKQSSALLMDDGMSVIVGINLAIDKL